MSYPHQAHARFQVTGWSEQLVTDIDGTGTTAGGAYYPDRGVTRTEASYRYTGDIEGTSQVVALIAYKQDAAPVLGMERFEGAIAGHEGTCVFRQTGSQDRGSVTLRLEVVPGLGTGGLADLRGEAELSLAGHRDDGYPLVLSFSVG